MQNTVIFRVLGLLLMFFSLTLLPPIVVDSLYQEHSSLPFWDAFVMLALSGLVLWYPFRRHHTELRLRDGFWVVMLLWTALALAGALPFWITPHPAMSFTDSVFESISGITATGATVLSDLDTLPKSLLYYRHQLQFFGGLGILILAVAIIPMLGVGGMQLFRAEATGPMKDNKLTPRIKETAKGLWAIYLSLTVACIASYAFLGMSWFHAVCYGFSTVSTGGFAPDDGSFALYAHPSFISVAVFFMILGALSFPLHFMVLMRKQLRLYWDDEECRSFFILLGIALFFSWLVLVSFQEDHNLWLVLFNVVSFSTTTGLTATFHASLPGALPVFFLFLGVIGGCAGSTAGGIKLIRLVLLQKQGLREINRLIHPQGIYSIQFGGHNVRDRVIEGIWGFLAVYVAVFSALFLLLLLVEPDFMTAYTALLATFSNLGPGLAGVSEHYADLSTGAKWVLNVAMLAGRLEIFTLLVFLSPAFWRA